MYGVEPGQVPQSSHRLVLYPQGYPGSRAARSTCEALVHFCGGDSQRTFDLRRSSLQQSLEHAVRIRAFLDPHRPALSVVHDTVRLPQTVQLRAQFEQVLPIARTCIWALYWDPDADPNFLRVAQKQGTVIGCVNEGAIWRHTSNLEFLVLFPGIESAERLASESEVLAATRSLKRKTKHAAAQVSPLNVPLIAS